MIGMISTLINKAKLKKRMNEINSIIEDAIKESLEEEVKKNLVISLNDEPKKTRRKAKKDNEI